MTKPENRTILADTDRFDKIRAAIVRELEETHGSAAYLVDNLAAVKEERSAFEADAERLRAELDRYHALHDAAKAWRAMRAGTPTYPKPESAALIAAVDALEANR